MAHILFRCPHTGLNVQHWLDEDAAPPPQEKNSRYEAIMCPACGKLHFVNRSTGKTLGESRKP